MTSIPNSNKLTDAQKLAQLIRNVSPRHVDIPSEIRKDAKQNIFNNLKNNIDFYNVKTDIKLPKRLLPIGCPPTYKSVHYLSDTKAKKAVVDRFKEPEYNKVEKEVISQIRQDQGKLGLLSDVYRELSKGDDLVPRSKSNKVLPPVIKESEIREVEDLDYWSQQAKINRVRIGQDSQVEELKKEVARMILFLEEDGVTQSDRSAVDTIFNEMDASGKKGSAYALPNITSESKGSNSMDSSKSERFFKNLKSSSGLIRAAKGKEQQQQVVLERKASGGVTSSIMMESMDFDTSAKMGLKSQLVYYKGLHEPIEQQLVKQIEKIEGEIEKKRREIEVAMSEKDKIEERSRELKKTIDIMAVKKKNNDGGVRPSVTFIPGLVVTDEAYKKAMEEKMALRNLKDEFVQQNELLQAKQREITKLENECGSLRKKQNVFKRIQIKLYFKILKQGLDCRDDGLLWVVKILMKEGENITYDDFPEFLDHTSKTHVMQKSRQMNKLGELKAIEKTLVSEYKASFQGDFCNSRFTTILASSGKKSKESATSLTNIYVTPTRSGKKAHTMNDIEYSNSNSKNGKTMTQPGSMTSLNELDLELEVKQYELNMSEKAKASSLAYIQEEKDDEEERYVERTPYKTARKYAAASMNEIQSSRKNLNENLYKEAKNVIRQLCVKKSPVSQQHSATKDFDDSRRSEDLKVSPRPSVSKEEYIARIQSVQANISHLLSRIQEDDHNEGLRIVKGYDSKRARVDLDFYLACVLGVAQAEKLFARYTLKKNPL